MVDININEHFRHAADGDFYTKDNSSSNIKEIIFDIQFDPAQETLITEETAEIGVNLDFGRWFSRVVGISELENNFIDKGYIPNFSTLGYKDASVGAAAGALIEDSTPEVGSVRFRLLNFNADPAPIPGDNDDDEATAPLTNDITARLAANRILQGRNTGGEPTLATGSIITVRVTGY